MNGASDLLNRLLNEADSNACPPATPGFVADQRLWSLLDSSVLGSVGSGELRRARFPLRRANHVYWGSLTWMGLAHAASSLLQLGSTVVLARCRTPHEFGMYPAAFAMVGVVSVLQQLGLPSLTVREEVLTDEIFSTAFTVKTAVTALLSVVIATISCAEMGFLRHAGVRRVLLVLAITPPFGISAFLPSANLEQAGRLKEEMLVDTIGSVVGAKATIAFTTLGFSYISVAYSQAIGGAVYILMIVAGRGHIRHWIGIQAWRGITVLSL